MICTDTSRKITRSWGTATEYGHKPCGATATHTKQVKAAHHNYSRAVYSCAEHAREGYELIAVEEAPAEVVEEPTEELAVVATDAPQTSCPALAEPGNIHFMTVHCVECNAFRMSKMNPNTVEGWYRSGHFSQDEYEAYMYAWATSAYHYGSGGAWAEEPTDPKVVEIVSAIRRHAGITVPAELAA